MHLWAWATQPAPRAARQSEVVAVLPIGTSHARSAPCRVFPRPCTRLFAWQDTTPDVRKRQPRSLNPSPRRTGSLPLSLTLSLKLTLLPSLPLSLTLPLPLSLKPTSTQEDGSGWAAQRGGGSLVVR